MSNKYQQALDNMLLLCKNRFKDQIGFRYNEDLTTLQELIDKANIYDSLSKEIGCPLEVIIMALKVGIYTRNDSHLRLPDFGFYYDNFALYSAGANNSMLARLNTFYAKDYKKTWWLGSDLDEQH